MKKTMMRATFSTILLSSLGSTVLWLLLVPSFAAQTHSDSLVGLLGMERQVLGVVGALLVGVWADRGLIHRKFALLQGLQLVLAVVFLLTTWLGTAGPDFVLVWTAVRFALVGASSVLAYRLLADVSGSSSQGAVLQMVTSPQGAMVFAAVICAAVPAWTARTLVVALVFDLAASVLVLSLLAPRLERPGAPGEPGAPGTGGFDLGWGNVLARGADAVKSYWLPRLWPWNLLQIGFLVSLSGMMVYASVLAEAQDLVPTGIAFSGAWFFYGLAFWVTAPLLRSARPRPALGAGVRRGPDRLRRGQRGVGPVRLRRAHGPVRGADLRQRLLDPLHERPDPGTGPRGPARTGQGEHDLLSGCGVRPR